MGENMQTKDINDVSGLEEYKFYQMVFTCDMFCNCNDSCFKLYKNEEDVENDVYIIVEFDNIEDFVKFVEDRRDLVEVE